MRIFEPQINNAEELVLLGFARPPANHPSFSGLGLDTLISTVGPVMHHMAIGPDNPIAFPAPYGAFNNILNEGDLLSHEGISIGNWRSGLYYLQLWSKDQSYLGQRTFLIQPE